MKHLPLVLYLIFFPLVILAQSLNPDFEATNYQLEKDIYSKSYGTKGLLLSFDYQYKNTDTRLLPTVPQVVLSKNGMEVYADETAILLLETNKPAKASIFIPYRNINLLNGWQEKVEIKLIIKGLLVYTTNVDYEQPTRCIVEIDLKAGFVKQQLKPYDLGVNPEEALPDPYYKFTSNEGIEPLYISPVSFNTFEIKPSLIEFSILEGEQIFWSFYDRDGGQDLALGVFDTLVANGDYKNDFFGQMFGNIKNLEFVYSQRVQARQALSIYSDATYIFKNKKGVAVTIEYDLAKSYVGKPATVQMLCYNKNGVQLNLPTFCAVEGTPEIGTSVTLQTKGKLKYFIPFYAWNNECNELEFYFELADKQQINAARHLLRRPVQFDGLVKDAGIEVQENFVFQGAKGVKIGVYYELSNKFEDAATLLVKFLDEQGKTLPFPVYNIMGNEIAIDIKNNHITKNPRIGDKMYYFVPYSSVNGGKILVQIDLVSDMIINLLKEKTPNLIRNKGIKDISLELVEAERKFHAESYGHLLAIKIDVPSFFVNKCKLNLNVYKNDKKGKTCIIDGYFNNAETNYILHKDTGTLYLLFPHRNLKDGDSLYVNAFVTSAGVGVLSSDTIEWGWNAHDLYNRKVEVALEQCVFDKKIVQDTTLDKDFPWYYTVEVGGEVLVQEVLERKNIAKKLKEQFKHNLWVNREDNIIVWLIHKNNIRRVLIWKGDLGKWSQFEFEAEVEDSFPIKKLKVTAKMEKQFLRKKSEGGGIL